jgi:hypothetical protein
MRALSVAVRKIAERFGVDLGRVRISRPRPFVDGTASASCSGRVRLVTARTDSPSHQPVHFLQLAVEEEVVVDAIAYPLRVKPGHWRDVRCTTALPESGS